MTPSDGMGACDTIVPDTTPRSEGDMRCLYMMMFCLLDTCRVAKGIAPCWRLPDARSQAFGICLEEITVAV